MNFVILSLLALVSMGIILMIALMYIFRVNRICNEKLDKLQGNKYD